jgi:LysM repeat protein
MAQRIAYLIVVMGMLLSSCSQATIQSTATIKPTELITPYHTVTPSQAMPTATIKITVPVTPSATPTPIIYTVRGDETMIEIAIQFGIDWKDLQAANPTVDPHYMGPGLQLVIPIVESTPEVLPTPTPVAIKFKPPRCYHTGEGGAWCILALRNDQQSSIENLSAWIGLYSPEGELIASQVVYAPLNILRSKSTMPLMAYFAPPLPEQYQAHSEVLNGLLVADDDTRYLDLTAKVNAVDISPDGLQAKVDGKIILPDETATISQLWVLAVAYDPAGNIIGVRKWKSNGETEFGITVYSLAGGIDHVEVLVEARP